MPETTKAKQPKTKKEIHPRGHVLSVSGTVIDVQFSQEHMPDILNALHIIFPKGSDPAQATIEVAQQLGDSIVRCIAIDNIFNISR